MEGEGEGTDKKNIYMVHLFFGLPCTHWCRSGLHQRTGHKEQSSQAAFSKNPHPLHSLTSGPVVVHSQLMWILHTFIFFVVVNDSTAQDSSD